jgi:hypothetical protein
MMSSDFLEFGIMEYVEEFESVTVYFHLKDKSIIAFDSVTHNPVRYQGWISIYHKWFGTQEVCSMIPASDFSYVSYVTKERKEKPAEDDGTEDGFQ